MVYDWYVCLNGDWDGGLADLCAASTFQAVSNSDRLDIVFSCTNRAKYKISVDNVKVKRFNGNAF